MQKKLWKRVCPKCGGKLIKKDLISKDKIKFSLNYCDKCNRFR